VCSGEVVESINTYITYGTVSDNLDLAAYHTKFEEVKNTV
jgi:hypothetical protein